MGLCIKEYKALWRTADYIILMHFTLFNVFGEKTGGKFHKHSFFGESGLGARMEEQMHKHLFTCSPNAQKHINGKLNVSFLKINGFVICTTKVRFIYIYCYEETNKVRFA